MGTVSPHWGQSAIPAMVSGNARASKCLQPVIVEEPTSASGFAVASQAGTSCPDMRYSHPFWASHSRVFAGRTRWSSRPLHVTSSQPPIYKVSDLRPGPRLLGRIPRECTRLDAPSGVARIRGHRGLRLQLLAPRGLGRWRGTRLRTVPFTHRHFLSPWFPKQFSQNGRDSVEAYSHDRRWHRPELSASPQ